ncbi:MAG: hypothetical protein SFV15_16805 [Polyangiaceae bacterium]|nr:hypothetical protein [Polyangiaceae bacterium]
MHITPENIDELEAESTRIACATVRFLFARYRGLTAEQMNLLAEADGTRTAANAAIVSGEPEAHILVEKYEQAVATAIAAGVARERLSL